jgi:GNAT superfamily N-acetyltransferase
VVFALRPHLTKEKYLSMVMEMQKEEGYTIAYIEDGSKVAAFTGYRRMQRLFTGKVIYIDDLSTLPEYRQKGYGRMLLSYIIEFAKKENLEGVDLDSGPTRHEAHRLYLNAGFKISSHHFALKF